MTTAPASGRRRVLFVDDDPRLLRGLRRLLDTMADDWDMEFAESGLEALEVMARSEFDAIVTDMRMPGMDGAELLHEVAKRHPHLVRVVLSGQSDQETRLRAAGPTHQFLTKPCDAETLRSTLTRACDLRDLLGRESLRRVVTQLQSLPSLPELHRELHTELLSPEPSIRRVGDLIARDIGMTAKLLQMVNSSFFGTPRNVASAQEATLLLGLNVVRDLVLSESVFSSYSEGSIATAALEAIRDHCALTGRIARSIAAAEKADLATQSDARLAGQLVDLGAILLAVNLPAEYADARSHAAEDAVPLWQSEVEALGAEHGEIGAYLLGLWGLPAPIVEAIAFHHRPSMSPSRSFDLVTVLHVADALAHERFEEDPSEPPAPAFDEAYLRRLGLEDRIDAWRRLATEARLAA